MQVMNLSNYSADLTLNAWWSGILSMKDTIIIGFNRRTVVHALYALYILTRCLNAVLIYRLNAMRRNAMLAQALSQTCRRNSHVHRRPCDNSVTTSTSYAIDV